MRSSNPAFKESTFLDLGSGAVVSRDAGAMTLSGTSNTTGILLLLAVLTGTWSWSQAFGADGAVNPAIGLYLWGGLLTGFALAMVTIFKKTWAPVTAPLYALVEGFFLGAISAMYNHMYQGIVLQAVMLTMGTLFAMLFAYRSGVIKATENFKLGVVAATGGIALVYLASIVLQAVMLTFGTLFALLFAYRTGLIKATENFKLGVVAATGGIMLVYLATIALRMFGKDIPLIHESGIVGIGFSLFVIVIAALNLVLDFDFIESGVEQGAPKYMEWYGAFGLMVTLVWLYVEFLRLLAKLQSRD